MKTEISLPDSLLKAADRLARRMGISRSELFQRAVTLLLERHEAAEVTAALDEVHGKQGAAGGLHEALARMQYASLPKVGW